ncbi:hypothetical protein [Plantactinospora sp. CA-290183]
MATSTSIVMCPACERAVGGAAHDNAMRARRAREAAGSAVPVP